MLLADHQQRSQDPLLSGLVCMHTCVWFTPDRLFQNPLGCSSCHQRHQFFSVVPQPLLTHTLLETCGLTVLIPSLSSTVHMQTCTPP